MLAQQQLTATSRPAVACKARSSGRSLVVVAQATAQPQSRRSALAALIALPAALLLAAEPALAIGKDPRQAVKEKEARRAKLKESAAKMKVTQKSESAFENSKYSLPESATTPNMRALENKD